MSVLQAYHAIQIDEFQLDQALLRLDREVGFTPDIELAKAVYAALRYQGHFAARRLGAVVYNAEITHAIRIARTAVMAFYVVARANPKDLYEAARPDVGEDRAVLWRQLCLNTPIGEIARARRSLDDTAKRFLDAEYGPAGELLHHVSPMTSS